MGDGDKEKYEVVARVFICCRGEAPLHFGSSSDVTLDARRCDGWIPSTSHAPYTDQTAINHPLLQGSRARLCLNTKAKRGQIIKVAHSDVRATAQRTAPVASVSKVNTRHAPHDVARDSATACGFDPSVVHCYTTIRRHKWTANPRSTQPRRADEA